MNALVKPEPAVGQVWYSQIGGGLTLVTKVENGEVVFGEHESGWHSCDLDDWPRWRDLEYLGTLDDLRDRATAGDLLYTDNSAVVTNLSAENERLRAALKRLTGSIDNWQNDHEVKDNAFWQAYENALAAVEGDAA